MCISGAPVSSIRVASSSTISIPSIAVSVTVGVGLGIGAAVAVSDLTGTTSASMGAHGPVAGSVAVVANGHNSVDVTTINAATGGGAVGIAVAYAKDARVTSATFTSTGNINAGGDVNVNAISFNHATAFAPGGALGGIAVAVMLPFAFVTGATSATVSGTVTASASTTVSALGDQLASAEADVASISLVGVNGAFADAEITSGANVEAIVGSGATIGSSGLVKDARANRPTQEIAVKTLAQVFDDQGLSHVDLMKMDIESYEYEALLGSVALFRQKRFRVLAIEVHPDILARRGKSAADIGAMLAECGYQFSTEFGNSVWSLPDQAR